MSYEYNKVRVADIPQEGLELTFKLDPKLLSERVNKPLADRSEAIIGAPQYNFIEQLPVNVSLNSDGSSVEMQGNVAGAFQTICSRCTGEAKVELDVPIFMILKPKKNGELPDYDDTNYGIYEGEVLNCAAVVEELIILALPYHVLCNENCLGLCPTCGANLNVSLCGCEKDIDNKDDSAISSPFAGLKKFKVQ